MWKSPALELEPGSVTSSVLGSSRLRPAAPAAPRYADGARPFAISHRGAAGLAPENTLAACRAAAGLGIRYLEVDVRLTADGVCVVVHDRDLCRVNGRRVPVAGTTWGRLRQERVGGEPVPSVEELLTSFPQHNLVLDVKEQAALGPLADLLDRTGSRDRVCLAGLSDAGVAEARARLRGVTTALGRESLIRLGLAAVTGRTPRRVRSGIGTTPFVHLPWQAARTPALAARWANAAHAIGADIVAWTVNDARTMRMLLDEGFDGIITDRPDVLNGVLGRA